MCVRVVFFLRSLILFPCSCFVWCGGKATSKSSTIEQYNKTTTKTQTADNNFKKNYSYEMEWYERLKCVSRALKTFMNHKRNLVNMIAFPPSTKTFLSLCKCRTVWQIFNNICVFLIRSLDARWGWNWVLSFFWNVWFH